MGHDDGTNETTPCGASADGTQLQAVSGVFLESEEVGGMEGSSCGPGDVAGSDEVEIVEEDGKIWQGRGLVGVGCLRTVTSEVTEEISVVSKGASGAFFNRTEGGKEELVFDGEGLGLLVLFV